MSPDQIESLQRLKRAFDVGLITELEFEAAKRALLQEIGVSDAPKKSDSPGGLLNVVPDGVEGIERQTTLSSEQAQASSSRGTRRLWSRLTRTILFVAVGLMFLSVLLLFTLRGGGSFNKSAVQAEIEFLFSDVSPNETEGYLRFVGRACDWNQKEQLDFAEGRVALLDAEDGPAFDHFRNEGVADFLTLIGIGCGSTAQSELTEVLTAWNGFFLPEIFLTPGQLGYFRQLKEDPSTDPDEWETMSAVRPVDEVNLEYGDVGDFTVGDLAFATWWRTMYVQTTDSGIFDGSTLDPVGKGFWKFWKLSDSGGSELTSGEVDYYFCKHQGDGICLSDAFLKVTPKSAFRYEFVGLGTIEEVERGEGSPGRIAVVALSGDGTSYISSRDECPLFDGEFRCFTVRPMGFVFSGGEKALLLNVKNHVPDSNGAAALISELDFVNDDGARPMVPCRLSSSGGEFFRDYAMKFDYLFAKNLWFPEVDSLDPHYFTGGGTFILCLNERSQLDSNWSIELPDIWTYLGSPGNYELAEWRGSLLEWEGELGE